MCRGLPITGFQSVQMSMSYSTDNSEEYLINEATVVKMSDFSE